jgi:hypothetical protein
MADPVTDHSAEPAPADTLLRGLTPEERAHLETHRYVKSGDDLIWIEPGGRVRREQASRLYYVQTDRGVFRVSRITREVVEV